VRRKRLAPRDAGEQGSARNAQGLRTPRRGKSRARASAFWTRVSGRGEPAALRGACTDLAHQLHHTLTAPIPILRELTSGQRLRSRPDSDSPDYAAALGLAGHVLSLEGGHLRATMVPGESGERVPAE